MKSSAVKRFLQPLALSILFFLSNASASYAQIRGFDPSRHEVELAGSPAPNTQPDVATIRGFEVIVNNVLGIVVSLAGVIVFIMFVVGGFKYLTASGDPKQTEAAKGTLTHAVFGLAVIVFGYLFLQLVTKVTGIDVSVFQVYKP